MKPQARREALHRVIALPAPLDGSQPQREPTAFVGTGGMLIDKADGGTAGSSPVPSLRVELRDFARSVHVHHFFDVFPTDITRKTTRSTSTAVPIHIAAPIPAVINIMMRSSFS